MVTDSKSQYTAAQTNDDSDEDSEEDGDSMIEEDKSLSDEAD